MAETEEFSDRKERLETTGRIAEIDGLLIDLDETTAGSRSSLFNALTMLVVDAVLDGDESALDHVLEELQRRRASSTRIAETDVPDVEDRGRLLSLIDVAHWGLERVLPLGMLAEFEVNSLAHRILERLSHEAGLTNRRLADDLNVHESQISHTGRRLLLAGVARRRRVGRMNHWEITPKGVQALGALDTGGINRPRREERQLTS